MRIKIKEKLNKKLTPEVKGKIAGVAASAMVFASQAFCEISMESTINKVGGLILNILLLGGIFLAILGVVNIAKVMTSGEQDQHGFGKNVGQLIGGVAMAAGPRLLLAIFGLHASTLGTDLFAGF